MGPSHITDSNYKRFNFSYQSIYLNKSNYNFSYQIDRSFYNLRFANIRKKTVKSPRFAHEIFMIAFLTEKRQLSYKYVTRNSTFCQE
jgi:hypothetical protein